MTRSEYRAFLMARCPRYPNSEIDCVSEAWCPVVQDKMPESYRPLWECFQISEWRAFLLLGVAATELLQKIEETEYGR